MITRRHFLSGILGALVLVGVGILSDSTPVQAQTKDPEEYNYLPLTIEGGGFSKDNLIESLVYDQGYEVQCAAPQWKIKPKVYGDYQRYFELNPGTSIIARGKPDNYEINLADATIPMLRGNEAYDLTTKISSLEAFFGVSNPTLIPGDVNSTGVIQNLTTPGEQCVLKRGNFEAINEICGMLDGSSTCYMDRKIPETDIKILSLHYTLNGFEKAYLGHMEELNTKCEAQNQPPLPVNFCDDFTNTEVDSHAMFGTSKENWLRYVETLENAPLDVDTLYRIAFLVVAPTQNEEEGADDIFWFRQAPENLNSDDVKPPIVAAFRIPDFMTNKPLSLPSLKDSSQATRRVLTDAEILKKMDEADLEERRNKADRVKAHKEDYLSNPKSLIYCVEGDTLQQCKPSGDPEVVLKQTIYALVNGLGKNCDGLGGYIEEAGEIHTSAGFNPATRQFSGQVNNIIKQEAKQPFDWYLRIDEEHTDDSIFSDGYEFSVETNAWVVAPLGTEMIHLDGALKTFFFSETYDAMVFHNCLADYPSICGTTPLRYPIKGRGVVAMNASSTIKEFIDPNDPVICRDEKDKKTGIVRVVCEPKKRQVILTLTETRGPMGVWGAKIGWMIRKISEAIRPIDIQIECTRTEDLFLGKCSIKPLGGATPSATVPSTLIDCPLELGYKEEIAQAVIEHKDEYMQEIKRYHPNTKMNGEMYDFVVEYSRQNGWNPGVILALGREETAWGSVGAPHWLGCMAGDPGSITNNIKHAQQQMDCVFKYFQPTMSCAHFMCRYAEGVDGESCVFTVNPEFPKNLAPIYRFTVDPYTPPITESGTLL